MISRMTGFLCIHKSRLFTCQRPDSFAPWGETDMAVFACVAEIQNFDMFDTSSVIRIVLFEKLSHFMDCESHNLSLGSM